MKQRVLLFFFLSCPNITNIFSQLMSDNPLPDLAHAYVNTTNTIVFLTGKAGTGKTTFLQQVRQTSQKRLAIVAPTGVAAINAGGMTIHSLFQLPFGPLLPNTTESADLHYSAEKRALLQSLELLIVDEISMVRPDVLDQIDLILRNVRSNQHAFGGVQLLLIGDLAQLSPIIREDEWALLRKWYTTPYFFSSLVLQKTPYVRIEFDKVYRQSDQTFVHILNEIREQRVSAESLEKLNERYIPEFRPTAEDAYITLTTHNSYAQAINQQWLDALETPETEYKASIRGEFPADAYPTDLTLKLKTGAQVMFVKNDSSPEKRYYNGKIGTVIKLENDTVHVATPDRSEIAVQALEWSNVKYQADGDKIGETNAGSFAQIPLKTAWAITIHKSQGLTFDKAVIDVAGAFTHGQAYVAFSRCRSLQGLILRSPVSTQNIIGDPTVARFNNEAASRTPTQETLRKHQEAYRLYQLTELFNFNGLKQRSSKFMPLMPELQTLLLDVADKMKNQLPGYSTDRIWKAAAYFHEKLAAISTSLHQQLTLYIGTSKELAAKADELLDWMMNRLQLLEIFSVQPFTTEEYLKQLRNKRPNAQLYLKAVNAKPNQALLDSLIAWRDETAKAENMLTSMLFTEQTLAAVAAKLPATLKALSGVKGIGPEKTTRYGAAILQLIRNYQQQQSGAPDQASMF